MEAIQSLKLDIRVTSQAIKPNPLEFTKFINDINLDT